jgi:hypothetical protein
MKLTPPFFRASLVFASLPVHGYLRRLLHDAVEVFGAASGIEVSAWLVFHIPSWPTCWMTA